MSIDAVGAFIIVFLNLAFWSVTLFRKSLGELARAYFWWSFSVTLWALGYGLTLSGLFNYDISLLWNRFCQAMAMLVGPLFFRLGCILIRKPQPHRKVFLFYLWAGIINAFGLLLTPWYVEGLWSFGPYRYQPSAGPLYSIFVLIFFWTTLHAFLLVGRSYREMRGLQKKQVSLFLWGTGISYAGGFSLFLQAYHIPFGSHGVFLILVHVLLIGYLVYRYNFFDLDVLVDILQKDRSLTMGVMAASINHEIRNPLFIIQAHAENYLDKRKRGLFENEEQALRESDRIIQSSIEQSRRALDIMQRFSLYVKDGISHNYKREKIRIAEALLAVRPFLNYEFLSEEVRLVDDLRDPSLEVTSDRKHLEEILFNLIRNGCQAMEGSGTLTVRADRQDGEIRIIIEDTGPGIVEAEQGRIFEPLYSTRPAGTGLGLYITRQLVEQNRGRIEVDSRPGEGTRFTVVFPE